MSDWGEPKRWYESDLPDPLRDVLDAAADDEPGSDRVALLESRVAPLLGWHPGGSATGGGQGSSSGAGGGGAGTGTTSVTGGASAIGGAAVTALKLGLGTLLAVGAVGGGIWLAGAAPRLGAEDPSSRAHAPPSGDPTLAEQVQSAVPGPTTVSEEQPPRPSLAWVPEIDADSASDGLRSRTTPAPERGGRGVAADRRTAANGTLAEELALVEAIRATVDTDPRQALRLAAEHERAYPDGALGLDRELLSIEALFRLGRDAEAEARADQLLTRHAGSPHATRLRGLLAAHRARSGDTHSAAQDDWRNP